MAAFARVESDLDGKKDLSTFRVSDEELQSILDWLGSLEAQK